MPQFGRTHARRPWSWPYKPTAYADLATLLAPALEELERARAVGLDSVITLLPVRWATFSLVGRCKLRGLELAKRLVDAAAWPAQKMIQNVHPRGHACVVMRAEPLHYF